MNTFHTLVPVILVQLISQIQCVDHRRGLHKLPRLRPGSHQHPPANPYLNQPYGPNPLAMNPYQPGYQPFPFGMPNMPFPAFALPWYPGPYTQPGYTEDSDYTAPSSDSSYDSSSSYTAPNSPASFTSSYIPPQSGYSATSSSYMPSMPPITPTFSYTPSILPPTPTSVYTPSIPQIYPSTSYTPNQFSYMPPLLPYISNPTTYLTPQYAPSPQASYVTPSAPTSTSTQTTVPSHQTYLSPVQAQSPQMNISSPYLANLTFSPQLPAPMVPSYDSSSVVPGVANATPVTNSSTPMSPIPVNPPNDFAPNPLAAIPLPLPEDTADETPVIQSNGETSTDLDSLPPQVKDFIDMIPNILAMPESSALATNDLGQPAAVVKPRQSPFSLRKHRKELSLHKKKMTHLPSYYPSYPAAPYQTPPYPSPPYMTSRYQPPLPLPVPSY